MSVRGAMMSTERIKAALPDATDTKDIVIGAASPVDRRRSMA
jgi:hypothetical protein